MKTTYDLEQARSIADRLNIDLANSGFDLEQFRAGLDVEAEHGEAGSETNVTDDDPLTTGKIALAHLKEAPDYYTRLQKMEAEAETPSSGVLPKLLIGLGLVIAGVVTACMIARLRARDR